MMRRRMKTNKRIRNIYIYILTICIPILSRHDDGGVHCWIRRCKFLFKNAMTTGVMNIACIGGCQI